MIWKKLTKKAQVINYRRSGHSIKIQELVTISFLVPLGRFDVDRRLTVICPISQAFQFSINLL